MTSLHSVPTTLSHNIEKSSLVINILRYSSSLSNVYLDFCGRNFLNVLSGGAVLLLISSPAASVISVSTADGAVVGCRIE